MTQVARSENLKNNNNNNNNQWSREKPLKI
jgi:hypothetical protein